MFIAFTLQDIQVQNQSQTKTSNMSEEVSSKDLPMSANLQDIAVKHISLDLSCNMDEQVFDGSVILWCRPAAIVQNTSEKTTETQNSASPVSKNEDFSMKEHQTLALKRKNESAQFADKNTSTDTKIPPVSDCAACDIASKHCVECAGTLDVNNRYSVCIVNSQHSDICECDYQGDKCLSKTTDDISVASCPCDTDSGSMKQIMSSEITTGFVSRQNEVASEATYLHHFQTIESKPACSDAEIGTVSVPDHGSKTRCDECGVGVCNSCSGELEKSVSSASHETEHEIPLSSTASPSSCYSACKSEPFKMILDSCKLDLSRVEGIFLQGIEKQLFEEDPETFIQRMDELDSAMVLKKHYRCPMQFVVKEHCIHTFIETVQSVEQFPHAVQIWYRTCPDGPSLKWTSDQDGKWVGI